MVPRKWNAYRTLNLTDRDSHGMTCVGSTKHGHRCRWDIVNEYEQIRAILDYMETRPPNEAIGSLRHLARLSLCKDWHQRQINDVVLKWEGGINEAAAAYEQQIAAEREIRDLEQSLAEEEAKNKKLQAEVDELRAKSGNQRPPKFDEELVLYKLKREQEESAAAAEQLNTALRTCKKQEYQIREYKKISEEVKQNNERLEHDIAQTLQQLAAESEAMRVMTVRYQEAVSTVSRLENEASAKSRDNDRIKLQNEQLVRSITQERNNLDVEVATLTKRVSQLSEESTLLRQAIEKTAIAVEWDKTTASNENSRLQSELEGHLQKYEDLTVEFDKLKNEQAALKAETETLRSRLVSEESKSVQQEQELDAAKKDLSATKLSLREAEASLEMSEHSNDKAKMSAAEKEKSLLAEISALVDQIDLMKNRPFSTFFVSLVKIFKNWIKQDHKWLRKMRLSRTLGKHQVDGNDNWA